MLEVGLESLEMGRITEGFRARRAARRRNIIQVRTRLREFLFGLKRSHILSSGANVSANDVFVINLLSPV